MGGGLFFIVFYLLVVGYRKVKKKRFSKLD